MKGFTALASLAAVSMVSARTFTVKNSCPYTVWKAHVRTIQLAGKAPQVPRNRLVSRTIRRRALSGAALNVTSPLTPDPPPVRQEAVTADWRPSCHCGRIHADYNYDVSVVDGFNMPMKVTNNKGCGVPSCSADLTPKCPSQLAYKDSTGAVAGCLSACSANLDGMPGNSANCCSGSHNTLPTGPKEGVAFYDYFKSACLDSYVYAFDEPSGTALWHCDSNLHADFTIDFCA